MLFKRINILMDLRYKGRKDPIEVKSGQKRRKGGKEGGRKDSDIR